MKLLEEFLISYKLMSGRQRINDVISRGDS